MKTRETKTEAKARLNQQAGAGRRMITGAEFEYGIGRSITREEFDARIAEGNRLILSAYDEADALNVRLHYYAC